MDIMIDIETLGLKSDATILSIGAVEFGATDMWDEFYREVDPAQLDRNIDPQTVLWWLNQPGAAFLTEGKKTLNDALSDLTAFMYSTYKDNYDRSIKDYEFRGRVWAKSPVFDLAILRHAYEQLGLECPWAYHQERDIRTVQAFVDKSDYPLFVGTKHNALDDAKHQAELVQLFLKETGTTL